MGLKKSLKKHSFLLFIGLFVLWNIIYTFFCEIIISNNNPSSNEILLSPFSFIINIFLIGDELCSTKFIIYDIIPFILFWSIFLIFYLCIRKIITK